jgi:hypothetical protein
VSATLRRSVAAAVAALLVGATMALIALSDTAGRPMDPRFPAVAASPLPGAVGEVAVVTHRGVPCVLVVDVATGAERELRCERDLVTDAPRWVGGTAIAVVRRDGAASETLVLDARDGTVVRRALVDGPEPRARRVPLDADGRRLVVGSDEDTTWLEVVGPEGTTRRVLTAPAEAWDGFTAASWGPDGRFALVDGAAAHLLVDTATGDARVLVDGSATATWRPDMD